MNNISDILIKYNILKDSKISSVEWLAEKSTKDSILFYRFNLKNEDEMNKFEERMINSDFNLCIVNTKINNPPKNIYSLSDAEFESLKKEVLKRIYPLNQENLKILGVTGTNGKTTVTKLVEQIYLQQKKGILSIGTLGVCLDGENLQSENLITSLSLVDLTKLIYEYQNKVSVIVMEITSHGLDQGRYGDIKLDAGAWTNLTQDHLDYHGTMEAYFKAKLKILKMLKVGAKLYLPKSQDELISKINEAYAVEWKKSFQNPFFKVNYNLDNLSLAIYLLEGIVDQNKINIEQIEAPAGRFNIIKYEDSYIVIDYAHSPDGIESICRELRANFQDYDLITLFGCGGNRDKTKRPLMGKASSLYSNHLILTSDNPRFEDPQEIINDIKPGVSITFDEFVDRKEAIAKGLAMLHHSVLLIAGKGHEKYIEIQGKKFDFNDLDVVTKLLGEKNVNK